MGKSACGFRPVDWSRADPHRLCWAGAAWSWARVTAAASEQVGGPQPWDLSGPGAELVLQVTGSGRRSGLGWGSVCHQG